MSNLMHKLGVASRGALTLPRLAIGALAMGLGICSMHYIGMAGMRMSGNVIYDPLIVDASVEPPRDAEIPMDAPVRSALNLLAEPVPA